MLTTWLGAVVVVIVIFVVVFIVVVVACSTDRGCMHARIAPVLARLGA